ncbi:hypothetical protein QOZ88_13615 [Blastococcus sp. BMG 814]|uniref:Integral membrane protein n=1 Tax=Blastococcus carthaginiensis TaxID=3050034 RepID=A0ABT9IDL0_9ACTN|nr:hypothetical protein [Blastococcus carthaginiensis]MDP5183675.1 hypothetical protein [Blastococcus carthaginiensis]
MAMGDGPPAERRGDGTEPGAQPASLRVIPGVALLVLAIAIAVGTLATAWAPSIGDGRSQVCRDRGVPYTPPYENWYAEAETSWLPLGISCTWTAPTAGDVVRQEPSWTPTIVAGVSLGLGSMWITTVGLSRLGRGAASRRSRPTEQLARSHGRR